MYVSFTPLPLLLQGGDHSDDDDDDEEEEDGDGGVDVAARVQPLADDDGAFVRRGLSKAERQQRKQDAKEQRRATASAPPTALVKRGGFDDFDDFDDFGDDDDDDDAALGMYKAASKSVASKKQARAEAQEAKVQAARERAAAASSEEEVDGERRATKSILKNRGLMKYRNTERKCVVCCRRGVVLRVCRGVKVCVARVTAAWGVCVFP